MPSKPKDLAGHRFGRLTVIEISGTTSSNGMRWMCDCDCGKKKRVASTNLISGNTKSCGCLRDEVRVSANTVHGMSKTRIFSSWNQMMARCYCETNYAFHRYGGRGVVVDERWHLFANFFADMGHRPAGRSLDRIDNDGPYSFDNCRWATATEQNRNKRDSRLLTVHGKTKCLSEWCQTFGLNAGTVLSRLDRYGWDIERALSTPARFVGARSFVSIHPVMLPDGPAQRGLFSEVTK